MSNANLVVLIESNAEACKFFLSLPEGIQAGLHARSNEIQTLDDLKNCANQLSAGN